MNIEDIKDFIRNRALRYADSCSSQDSMEFNVLNELYFDLFGEPAVNTIPKHDNLAIKVHHIENGHEYVDLGLPSGTLWATCNVGATRPEEYGNYIAWGETTEKDDYGWSAYKYGVGEYNGNYSKIAKYNISDSKTTLDLADDAAYINWGDRWRMPTYEQQDEIRNECYWVWTENYKGSNVKGYIVYKAKGAIDRGRKIYKNEILSSSYTLYDTHIFLPAAGRRYNGGLYNEGLCGHYWFLLRDYNDPVYARSVFFNPYNVLTQDDLRHVGCTIRPVLNQDL